VTDQRWKINRCVIIHFAGEILWCWTVWS